MKPTPPSLAMTFVIALGCSALSGYLSWHFTRAAPITIAVLDDQQVLDALNQAPERMDETLKQLETTLHTLRDDNVIVLDKASVKTPDLPEVTL